MAAEARKIKQLRYYQDNDPHNAGFATFSEYCDETSFIYFAPIEQLGIQALPGTKFYLNQSLDPIIIGGTGIYELDLRNTTAILSSLRFDPDSMKIIRDSEIGHLIIDMVYTGGN